MKKLLFTITLFFACFATAVAQQAKIGYFSYQEVLQSMPDYKFAMDNVDKLRKQYAEELKAAEDEFNEKYELFLDQQAKLAEAIRQKRQADLQDLLKRNDEFRKESERLLKQAEKDFMAPVKTKLNNAIRAIGMQGAYLVILNTDSEACPYIDATLSEDVTTKIIDKAK